MADSSTRLLRLLAALLVRGPHVPSVLGDLDESLRRDLERGLSLRRARWRYATNALGSAFALWRVRVRLPFPAPKRLYDHRRILWFEQLQQDVRYAGRSLRRTPVFAIAAILTLGLGIGANTALFTVTRGVLLKTLPVERPEHLVEIGCVNPDNPDDACRTHYPGFLMFHENTDVLSGVFAFAPTSDLAANIGGRSEVVEGLMVSANSFSVLGLAPYAGRLFSPADDEPGAPLSP